jgi:hypothetical protein
MLCTYNFVGKSKKVYTAEVYPFEDRYYKYDTVCVIVRAELIDDPNKKDTSSDVKTLSILRTLYVGEESPDWVIGKLEEFRRAERDGATHLCLIPEKNEKKRRKIIDDLIGTFPFARTDEKAFLKGVKEFKKRMGIHIP